VKNVATPLRASSTAGTDVQLHGQSVAVRRSLLSAEGARIILTTARRLLLAAVFVISLETTARVDEWLRYGTSPFTRVIAHEYLLLRDAGGIHGRPHARYKRWVMNSLGLQGPEVSETKHPGTLRIVTIGASETAGYLESVGREYPRQLQALLSQRITDVQCAPMERPRVELLNAALAGMSLPTQTRDVETRLRRLHPDVIVVYPSPVQYLTPSPPDASLTAMVHGAELPLLNALQPRVWPRLRDEMKKLTPGFVKQWLWQRHTAGVARAHSPGWRFTTPPPERLELFERDLRALIEAIRDIGAIPVLATHANAFMRAGTNNPQLLAQWEHFYARATGQTIIDFDAAARFVMIRVAHDADVPVVDIAAILASSNGDVFADFVHFTDKGAAIVADALAEGVIATLPWVCVETTSTMSSEAAR
jgi:hypothetical protein